MNMAAIIKNETLMIKISIVVCGVIVAGVLIGLWQYGVDLSSVFLGTHWDSPHPQTKGMIAIEGGIVAITLLFGGLFIAGLMALRIAGGKKEPPKDKTSQE